jgi:hypothetical protein
MCLRSSTGASTLVAALLMTITSAAAFDESKYPDWGGQWHRPAGVVAQWDQTKPPGLGQQAPLTPEYQGRLEAHRRPGAGRARPQQPL